jgi:uncharacterized protein
VVAGSILYFAIMGSTADFHELLSPSKSTTSLENSGDFGNDETVQPVGGAGKHASPTVSRMRLATSLSNKFKMPLLGWQDCAGHTCKNDLPSKITVVFGAPARHADKLDDTLAGLDKVFTTTSISTVIVKGTNNSPGSSGAGSRGNSTSGNGPNDRGTSDKDSPRYHPVPTSEAPGPTELLVPLMRTAIELQTPAEAADTITFPAPAMKSVEKPLLQNLLTSFDRKRLKLDVQDSSVDHKDPQFHFDEALVRMQLGEPIDNELKSLEAISKRKQTSSCESDKVEFLIQTLTLLQAPGKLSREETVKIAHHMLQDLPDDLYRLQALHDLALKCQHSDLPGLTDSDSEKDLTHSAVLMVLIAAISLASPIFAFVFVRQLLAKKNNEDENQQLSAVTYGWKRMLIVLGTLILSLLLVLAFELSAGFASEIDTAVLAINHPIVRIMCDLIGSTLYNLPVLLVYFAWCIPQGISFSEGFGLRTSTAAYSFKKLCSMGLIAYLALNTVSTAALLLMLIYHHPDSVSDASSSVATSLSLGAATLLFFVESLFGPLMEELCFRGVLYRGLRASWGIVPSLIVSSLWFAVLHNDFSPWLLFHKFAVGAVNALLYEKTKSLVPAVVAHCLNNIFLNFA